MPGVNGAGVGTCGSVIVDDGQTWTYQPETITNAQPATHPQMSWKRLSLLLWGRGEVCPLTNNLNRNEHERPTGAANKRVFSSWAFTPPSETNKLTKRIDLLRQVSQLNIAK